MEEIEFDNIGTRIDIPEQQPVDDDKIAQEIEDWIAYKKMKQNEVAGI